MPLVPGREAFTPPWYHPRSPGICRASPPCHAGRTMPSSTPPHTRPRFDAQLRSHVRPAASAGSHLSRLSRTVTTVLGPRRAYSRSVIALASCYRRRLPLSRTLLFTLFTVQLELGVECLDRPLHIARPDHRRHLDLGRGDQLNVDARGGQGAKHARRDARVADHAGTDRAH